jgi:hypothetical protein
MAGQLAGREHLAGGIVRRVEDDGAGALVESLRQLGGIEAPVRRAQRHEARRGAAEHGIRTVVFVEGLEDDDLVTRIDERQHRRDHRFGGAAGDRDLGLGIDGVAALALRLGGDRVAEALGAPGDGVLVDVGVQCRGGSVLESCGCPEIGKSLRQIDGVVLARLASHVANHRLGELPRLHRRTTCHRRTSGAAV